MSALHDSRQHERQIDMFGPPRDPYPHWKGKGNCSVCSGTGYGRYNVATPEALDTLDETIEVDSLIKYTWDEQAGDFHTEFHGEELEVTQEFTTVYDNVAFCLRCDGAGHGKHLWRAGDRNNKAAMRKKQCQWRLPRVGATSSAGLGPNNEVRYFINRRRQAVYDGFDRIFRSRQRRELSLQLWEQWESQR